MIVVADTSVLSYLIVIEYVGILQKLYGHILLPRAVFSELQSPHAPGSVSNWVRHLPDWITIADSRLLSLKLDGTLGSGEREAITIAVERKAKLLIDDRLGRKNAHRYGLEVIGTLGILRDASDAGHLDLADALKRLSATSFRASQSLLNDILSSR